MQRQKNIFPIISLALGAAAYFLRRWQLETGFESGSGLAKPGAPAALALLGLTAATVLGALLLAVLTVRGRRLPAGYETALRPDKPGAFLLWIFSVAMTLAAGAWLVGSLGAGLTQLLLTVFGVLAGLGALACVQGLTRGQVGPVQRLGVCIPPVLFCFWLVQTYRDHLTDPVLMHYGWTAGAMAFLALSWYYEAGILYRRPRPGAMLFTTVTAAGMTGAALADASGWVIPAILVFHLAHRLVSLRSLVGNLAPAAPGEK